MLTLVRFLVAGTSPLSPDEAYYWTWSRALAPGYPDHPFMVALWIRLGTLLAGGNALGVRLMAPLSAAAGTVLLRRAGEDLLPGSGLPAAVLFNATLFAAAGAVTMTPDTPLLFFWAAGLWAMGRLVATGRDRWWWVVGGAGGLALDSKYTAVLFGAGVAVWLAGSREARRRLIRPEPWGAAILAAVLFAPVVAWNASHGWASFARQGGRIADWAPRAAVRYVGELLGSQAALATPLVFVMCVWGVSAAARRWRSNPGSALLVSLTVVPLAVFVQHALGDRVQANWPAVLYPSACICAGGLGRWWRTGAGVGFALAVPVYLQSAAGLFPLPRQLDPTLMRLAGWDELARGADRVRQASGADFLTGEPYGVEAELAWHLPAGTVVLSPSERWRLVALPRAATPGSGVLVQSERRSAPDPGTWSSVDLVGRLVRGRGGVEAEAFRVYRVVPRSGMDAARLPLREDPP